MKLGRVKLRKKGERKDKRTNRKDSASTRRGKRTGNGKWEMGNGKGKEYKGVTTDRLYSSNK